MVGMGFKEKSEAIYKALGISKSTLLKICKKGYEAVEVNKSKCHSLADKR